MIERARYGSHTGTAEGLAHSLVATAQERGIPAVAHDLAMFTAERFLDNASRVVLLLATHGVGNPTKSAQAFDAWLKQAVATTLILVIPPLMQKYTRAEAVTIVAVALPIFICLFTFVANTCYSLFVLCA